MSQETVVGSHSEILRQFSKTINAWSSQQSVGCLPLVMFDEDENARVSRLGLMIADELSDMLIHGASPDELRAQLSHIELPETTVFTTEAAMNVGPMLGVDVLVYGVIRKAPSRRGMYGRDLNIEIFALNLRASPSGAPGSQHDGVRFTISSTDPTSTRAFDNAESEIRWTVAEESLALENRDYERDLDLAIEALAKRIARCNEIRSHRSEGAVLVQIVHCTEFIAKANELAAQSYQLSEAVRAWKIQARNDRKLVWRGEKWDDPTQAYQAIDEEWSELDASEAGKFGRRLALQLSRALSHEGMDASTETYFHLSPQARIRAIRRMLGPTEDPGVFEELTRQGCVLVIAPQLERLGSHYSIRAAIFKTSSAAFVTAHSTPIHARHIEGLAGSLGVRLTEGELPYQQRIQTP